MQIAHEFKTDQLIVVPQIISGDSNANFCAFHYNFIPKGNIYKTTHNKCIGISSCLGPYQV